MQTEKTLITGELQSLQVNNNFNNSKENEYKKKLNDYEQKILHSNKEIIRQREEIEELSNKCINCVNESKARESTINSLRAEINDYHKRNSELEIQLHEMKSKSLSESIESRKLKNEHDEVVRCFKQAQDKLSILQSTLESLKNENNNNRAEKETLENDSLVLHSKMNKLEIEYYSTKSQLTQLESKSRANEKAYKALQEDYNRLLKRQDFIIDSPSNKRSYKSNFTSLNNTMQVVTAPIIKRSPEEEPKKYKETKYKQNISTVGEMMKWDESQYDKRQDFKTGNRAFGIDNKEIVAEVDAKIQEISSEKKKLEAEYSKFSSKSSNIAQRKRKDEICFEIDLADKNINKLKQKLRELAS